MSPSDAVPQGVGSAARTRLTAVLLTSLYLLTRSYQLALLPLFIDESLHLYWTLRLLRESRLARLLDDGKLLQVLAITPVVPWVSDPVWWGRFVTVVVGAIGLHAVWRTGALLFGERVGLVAASLYLVCPFSFFYDRLALADAYLSSFTAAALYWSFAFRKQPSRRGSLWLGLSMAASILSKIPGLIALAWPPLCLLLGRPRVPFRRRLGLAYALAGALVSLPVIHFFSSTGQLAEKANLSVEQADRLTAIGYNLGLALGWLSGYWTAPVLVVGCVTALAAAFRGRRVELVLAACSLAPVAFFVLVSFQWYPRYVLFGTPPLLTLTACGLCQLDAWLESRFAAWSRGGRLGRRLLLAACVGGPGAALCVHLAIDPPTAPLPAVERFQYVDGWPSGYGWSEAASFLKAQADRSGRPVLVLFDRADHRTAHVVVRAYLMNDTRFELESLDLGEPGADDLIARRARAGPVFVLRSGARRGKLRALPESAGVELRWVLSLRKPGGRLVGEIYRADSPGQDPSRYSPNLPPKTP